QNHTFVTLVVDNGSTDGSSDYVREHFPKVKLIVSEENEGFSGAVNRGIRAADTPYVLLLNNDTEVEEGFVRHLEEALDKRPRYFGIQAKLLMMHEPDRVDDAGDLYSALGWAFAIGKGKPQERFDHFYPVFAPCAGAAIYRRDVMERIGLFDEAHFAYLEDIDIAYRSRIVGYRNGFCPAARVRHVGSGFSGSRYNEFKVRLSARNSIYLIYKNMPALQILLNLPFLLVGFVVKTLFFAKKGFGMLYVRSLLEGVRMCRDNRTKRIHFRAKNLRFYLWIQLELWIAAVRRFVG
ncbi:MAG: glycosyltransferase family 2 protein, partial [Lachnospiraceae bacterium]|nr:glycosyltransferase family 2 protein [Lachnospiraceae bacterium]